jgi:hypothetical protein
LVALALAWGNSHKYMYALARSRTHMGGRNRDSRSLVGHRVDHRTHLVVLEQTQAQGTRLFSRKCRRALLCLYLC